jgi:hypothetical protein
MPHPNGTTQLDARRELVNRLAASAYFNRSARLRNLLLYLTDRVLEEEAGEIHEQEVGHKVFGRPPNYDASSDNIVRVHASTLRKRLEQYFATEGAAEPIVLAIPKGNYAPVFHEPEQRVSVGVEEVPPVRAALDRRLLVGYVVAAISIVIAATVFIRATGRTVQLGAGPESRLLWSQIFRAGRATDLVLDDSAVALYQELTGKPLALSEYFDRSYLRTLAGAAAANLDPQTASKLVLHRQSSYAGTSFLWRVMQMPGTRQQQMNLRFARDYTFRDLRADDAVLVGNASTNPWIQPFEPKLGLRWQYDPAAGTYYPVDTWGGGQAYHPLEVNDGREGYFSVALVGNLGGTGDVLIVSGTGGSALNSGADFLTSETGVAGLRSKLQRNRSDRFPYFEALIRTKGRTTQVRDSSIVLCRPLRSF